MGRPAERFPQPGDANGRSFALASRSSGPLLVADRPSPFPHRCRSFPRSFPRRSFVMSRWRALIAVIALALVAGLGSMFGYAVAGPPERVGLARTKAVPERSRFLEIYYSSPMLVRAGEAVRMPA